MSISINKQPPLYLVHGSSLHIGHVYEGSDGLLYVGANITYGDDTIHAIGLGHNAYVDSKPGGEVIHFRSVHTAIDYR